MMATQTCAIPTHAPGGVRLGCVAPVGIYAAVLEAAWASQITKLMPPTNRTRLPKEAHIMFIQHMT